MLTQKADFCPQPTHGFSSFGMMIDVSELRSRELSSQIAPPEHPIEVEVSQPPTPRGMEGAPGVLCPVCEASFMDKKSMHSHCVRVCATGREDTEAILRQACATDRIPHLAT
eukprot:1265570-Pyramimonas_sp.AAC.1